MNINFPSPAFDDAVSAACHGVPSDEQVQALNALLRRDATALDEYVWRLELHARLASDPDLFVSDAVADSYLVERQSAPQPRFAFLQPRVFWIGALAACLVLAAIGSWRLWPQTAPVDPAASSKAVAMLSETADARWATPGGPPLLGAPLEPGWLKLEAGLAQVVFYSGARLVIEGPAELQLVSASHAVCARGKVTAEVPLQARGFQIDTPQGKVTDLGTAFGLEVSNLRTEVHVFKGEVTIQTASAVPDDSLREGSGAVMERSVAPHRITADQTVFASLFQLQAKSAAAEAARLSRWRAAGERLNADSSLAVRLDFDDAKASRWQLSNVSAQSGTAADATLVGCRWGEGRWPGKRALEFQSVSDRVRLNVPGECEALTIAAWVRVQGLDRKLNSLFMSDGFAPGSVHWLVRNDGVLGITIVGDRPGSYQIATSPPVLTLDRFGMWVHLAVVVNGRTGSVAHYVNGHQVAEVPLCIKPPYRIGTAELGNWNAIGFPQGDPVMIRNFSGAMDEFCLFLRPLAPHEIEALHDEGRPGSDILPSGG